MFRYYLTQRPPGPGCFPSGAVAISDYNDKIFVPEIGQYAWGWVEYELPLNRKQIYDYELKKGNGKIK